MQSEENENIDMAKSMDNVISNKINEILDKHPGSFEKGDTPLKSEIIESTTQPTQEPPESWKKEAVSAEAVVRAKIEDEEWELERRIEEEELEKRIEDAEEEKLMEIEEEKLMESDEDKIARLHEIKQVAKARQQKLKQKAEMQKAEIDQTPELISPVQAETFRKLDRIESDIETLMKAVLELTKSHDGLCDNIQTTVIESMTAPKKVRKRKEELYTSEQETMYKKILKYFTDKTGKTQRDLTNGTNQMVAAVHNYSLGQPGDSNTADFILAKVSKDYAVDNKKYLSVDQYLDIVKEYVIFITKDQEVVFD